MPKEFTMDSLSNLIGQADEVAKSRALKKSPSYEKLQRLLKAWRERYESYDENTSFEEWGKAFALQTMIIAQWLYEYLADQSSLMSIKDLLQLASAAAANAAKFAVYFNKDIAPLSDNVTTNVPTQAT